MNLLKIGWISHPMRFQVPRYEVKFQTYSLIFQTLKGKDKMETNSVLEELKELYKQKKLADSDNAFIVDGIINPVLFERQTNKVLFIAKEHNFLADQDYTNYQNGYIDWWNEHVHLQFSHRIAEWAYGIQNDFPAFLHDLDYDTKHNALKSIAFINVKKASGASSAHAQVIFDYIDQSRDLLHRQIKEINPTLIVTCFRYDDYPRCLFNIDMQRTGSNTFGYGSWNNISVVNYYHPSSRKSRKFLYEQLGEAIRYVSSLDNDATKVES